MAQGVIDTRTGEIYPLSPREAFEILDPYAEEGVIVAQPRPDWIASISAGQLVASKKDGGMPYPQASQDGTICISDPDGRAPKLAEILAANDNKRLTIVFPSDELGDFIQQRFTRRTATALEAYGDQYSLTEITITYRDGKDREGKAIKIAEPHHDTYAFGTSEYRRIKATCKAETSVLFAVGEWISTPTGGIRSQVSFPDGYGWYRVRFTSRHSLQSIVGKLQEVKQRVTNGRLAGLPFELSISYREVAGPDGHKRRIPVWALVFRPPETLRLTSGNLGGLLAGALAEGERLRLLPAPRQETLEMAQLESPDVDMDDSVDEARFVMPDNSDLDEAVRVMTSDDVPCDAAYYRAHFFGAVDGTSYDTDEGRAKLVSEYTITAWVNRAGAGWTDSLADFLAQSTEREASAFLAHVAELRGRDLASHQPVPPTGKQRIDTSPRESQPPTHAARNIARQAAALVAATPLEVPGASASNGPTSPSDSPITDPPPTVSDAVAPPPDKSTAKSATRAELERLWGVTAYHAQQAGLKSFVTILKLSDSELIDETAKLSARIREKERNDGSVDARDFDGAPTEEPSLPLGI